MTQYIAISMTLAGETIARRDFCCRKLITAQGITDELGTDHVIKLTGRTSCWYVNGKWHAGLAIDRALNAAGFVGLK